jgi:hypothetical protein
MYEMGRNWGFFAEYLLMLRAGVNVRTNSSDPIHSAMCTARIAPASGATGAIHSQ